MYNKNEGTQRFIFPYMHQNAYSEVPSKQRKKAIASKFRISYQNKDFKKSNVYEVILSQIRLQRLKLDIDALVYVLTNRILGLNRIFEKYLYSVLNKLQARKICYKNKHLTE